MTASDDSTPTTVRDRQASALRMAGAVLLVLGGSVHLQQWFRNYRTLEIGPMFLLNTLASVAVATCLFAGTGKAARLAILGGIGLSLASIATLFASRTIGLPGFTATGYDKPEIEAIVLEALTAATLLGAWLRSRAAPATSAPRPSSSTSTPAATPH